MTFRTESEKRRDSMREGMEYMRARLSELNLINSEVHELEVAATAAMLEYKATEEARQDALKCSQALYEKWITASDAARKKTAELTEVRSAIQETQLGLLTLSIEELGLGE